MADPRPAERGVRFPPALSVALFLGDETLISRVRRRYDVPVPDSESMRRAPARTEIPDDIRAAMTQTRLADPLPPGIGPIRRPRLRAAQNGTPRRREKGEESPAPKPKRPRTSYDSVADIRAFYVRRLEAVEEPRELARLEQVVRIFDQVGRRNPAYLFLYHIGRFARFDGELRAWLRELINTQRLDADDAALGEIIASERSARARALLVTRARHDMMRVLWFGRTNVSLRKAAAQVSEISGLIRSISVPREVSPAALDPARAPSKDIGVYVDEKLLGSVYDSMAYELDTHAIGVLSAYALSIERGEVRFVVQEARDLLDYCGVADDMASYHAVLHILDRCAQWHENVAGTTDIEALSRFSDTVEWETRTPIGTALLYNMAGDSMYPEQDVRFRLPGDMLTLATYQSNANVFAMDRAALRMRANRPTVGGCPIQEQPIDQREALPLPERPLEIARVSGDLDAAPWRLIKRHEALLSEARAVALDVELTSALDGFELYDRPRDGLFTRVHAAYEALLA